MMSDLRKPDYAEKWYYMDCKGEVRSERVTQQEWGRRIGRHARNKEVRCTDPDSHVSAH